MALRKNVEKCSGDGTNSVAAGRRVEERTLQAFQASQTVLTIIEAFARLAARRAVADARAGVLGTKSEEEPH